MEPETKIYLETAGILYKEKAEYQTFIHVVEDAEGTLTLLATVASNSFYAAAKVAPHGKIITYAPLAEMIQALKEEETRQLGV